MKFWEDQPSTTFQDGRRQGQVLLQVGQVIGAASLQEAHHWPPDE